MITKDELFVLVDAEMLSAKLIAWDGCHKIYLAMDDHEASWFAENYEHTLTGDVETLCKTVRDWYEASCFLRFVQSVSHFPENPNLGFVSLIPQGADEYMGDSDEED